MAQAPQPPQDTLDDGADPGALLGPGSHRADADYAAVRADLQHGRELEQAAVKEFDALDAKFTQRFGLGSDAVSRFLSSLPRSKRAPIDQAFIEGQDVMAAVQRVYDEAIGPLPGTLEEVNAELATINKAMRTDRKAYFANDQLRLRAVELYRLQEQLRDK